jgi:hypothetical protein
MGSGWKEEIMRTRYGTYATRETNNGQDEDAAFSSQVQMETWQLMAVYPSLMYPRFAAEFS